MAYSFADRTAAHPVETLSLSPTWAAFAAAADLFSYLISFNLQTYTLAKEHSATCLLSKWDGCSSRATTVTLLPWAGSALSKDQFTVLWEQAYLHLNYTSSGLAEACLAFQRQANSAVWWLGAPVMPCLCEISEVAGLAASARVEGFSHCTLPSGCAVRCTACRWRRRCGFGI